MSIWAWVQPVDRIWKVVTDSEKGTMKTYNEKEELIIEQEGMTKEEVSFIENNFLQVVATRLDGGNMNFDQKTDGSVTVPDAGKHEYNYMYA